MLYYVEIAYMEADQGLVLGCQTPKITVLSLCQKMGISVEDRVIGINGEAVLEDHWITSSCRVELYPPLRVTPIERRKRLVASKRKK